MVDILYNLHVGHKIMIKKIKVSYQKHSLFLYSNTHSSETQINKICLTQC